MRMRKLALTVVPALVFGAVGACSSDETPASAPDAASPDPRPATPPEWDRPVSRPGDGDAERARAACTYKRGALPDETLGPAVPLGKDMPIETIVVLMQENRSFDHYFGRYPRWAGRTDIEVPPDNATNPERVEPTSSETHAWQRAGHACFLDTAHSWASVHKQINGGKMDGFYETNHDFKGETMPDPTMALRDGERALWWYDERDIPFYYALAKEFGLGDHYFSSVPGPTWPNRMYLYAATSFGRVENGWPNIDAFPYPQNDAVILDELDKRRVDWKLYGNGSGVGAGIPLGVQTTSRYGREIIFTMDDFFADAAAGKLPPVAFVDAAGPNKGVISDDEHPAAMPQVGQKFVAKVVRAMFQSPQWNKSAFFLTYDEHGGLYDHVAPPKACVPDDKTPVSKTDVPIEGAFDMYGPRVPFIVVSPYAKRGHVSHAVYDHTSIVRFIQAKFRLPALTGRDANALPPTDFFDFAQPPRPPPELPAAELDEGETRYCTQEFKDK